MLLTPAQIKPQSLESRRNSFFFSSSFSFFLFLPGVDASHVHVRTWALGCFHSLKPVLNWANVCSPNILRTVRRTMIRFLIELLARWTWFGQFEELYFVLNWLVMRCKLRPELAADAQQTAWKCRLKSSQYTFIIPHRVLQLTTVSFWVSETRLRLPQVNK